MTDFIPALKPPSRQLSADTQAHIAAVAARREARQRYTPRPAHWLKPPFASAQYRYAVAVGWISEDEQRADFEAVKKRRETALQSHGQQAALRARDNNPAPRETRQYGRDYGTEHLRDRRLTPMARNLLGLIRARCGDGIQTAFTKGTMANCLGVSVRSIQRYVQELVRFGYITTEIRRGWGGLHTGLIVRIMEKVRPFYARPAMRAEWLKEEAKKALRAAVNAANPSKSGRTGLSRTNKPNSYSLLFGPDTKRNPPIGG